ncbi:MAG: hypothetical protein HQK79_23095, partial [Desulfobacterales bacterium]|nr:hypothetical protein [Desulfobacterales bacterium]
MMSDCKLEANRDLLEKELGEVLQTLWNQLSGLGLKGIVIETMMLLGVGVLNGAYTPYQVIERLELAKHLVYDALGEDDPKKWREIIQELEYKAFLEECLRVIEQSPSTQSRVCFTLIIDDSLFRRYAKQMTSIFKWWSGALKAVRKGHDVIGLMIE